MSLASAVVRIGAMAAAAFEVGCAALSCSATRQAAVSKTAASTAARDHSFIECSSAGLGNGNVERAVRCRENAPDHRFEEFQRSAVICRVERRLVLDLAEACGVLEVRMAAERLAHVAVDADVVEEIIALEDP